MASSSDTGSAYSSSEEGEKHGSGSPLPASGSSPQGRNLIPNLDGPSDEPQETTDVNLNNQASETTHVKHARLQSGFDDRYAQLVNDQSHEDGIRCEGPVQIGAVIWAAGEREQFFRAIATKPQTNLRALAKRVPSKSEAEIHHFLCFLKEEVKSLKEQSGNQPEITQADIPAAAELSPNFEAILERYADALVANDEDLDPQLVDRQRALDLDNQTKEFEARLSEEESLGDTGLGSEVEDTPGHRLFNLPGWIDLTERVFMNSGPTGDPNNWTTHAASDESPSVSQNVFEELYQLVLFQLRKLVQTALYCASSRHRALERSDYRSEQVVRQVDVTTATSLLGVSRNNADFWITLARRNRLRVVDHPRGRKVESLIPLSLEQVEEALLESQTRSRRRNYASEMASESATEDPTSPEYAHGSVDQDDPQSDEEGSESGAQGSLIKVYKDGHSDTDSADDENDSGDNGSECSRSDDSDSEQDRILDAVDQAASREHELELHRRLDLPPEVFPLVNDEQASVGDLRSLDDTRDARNAEWRDHTARYRQEWENDYMEDRNFKRKRDMTDLE